MTTPTQNLRPCPFCGSERLRIDPMLFCDDDGEQPGVECLDCDALNRLEHWNRRARRERNGGVTTTEVFDPRTHRER